MAARSLLMSYIQIILGGLLAGLVHVLSGPDHLTAVAPYATLQRSQAWRVGLRWGLGHTGGVLLIGALALLIRGVLPIERLSSISERLVGVVLLVIGLWGAWTAAKRVPEEGIDTSSSEGSSKKGGRHPHTHAAFGVGILHGLAGSSHLLGILPALALPSPLAAGTWLVLFGVGTVLGMTAFAAVIGYAAGRVGAFGVRSYRVLLYLCAFAAIAAGLFWLICGGA